MSPNTGDHLRNERDHRGKAGQEQTFCVRKAIPVPAVPAPQQLRGHPNTNSTLLGVAPQLLLRSGHSRYGNSFPNAKCLFLSGLPPVTACPVRYSTLLPVVRSALGIVRSKLYSIPPGTGQNRIPIIDLRKITSDRQKDGTVQNWGPAKFFSPVQVLH